MSYQPLVSINQIQKSFTNTEGQKLLVLENISFQIQNGEIVALLGKSGSGKTTLLRIISGLTAPSQGSITFQGKKLLGPIPSIAMVFQNFALLPWLTVLENVELGLEAQGIKQSIRRQKALDTIDVIGLDGFESAYPKELSGGMKQRVGIARALVVEPLLLLMDEPFSALDILTAENLRNDLLDLWHEKRTRTESILCVTHNIEEAILMANRILIVGSDPGRILSEIKVDLPFPRDPEHPQFRSLLDRIYAVMAISERDRVSKTKNRAKTPDTKQPDYAYRLPEVGVSEITGLLEAMESHEKNGVIDLPELAESLHLDVDNIFPLTEILDMLRFAKISAGDLVFLEAGKKFAHADILERKKLFAKQLLEYIPLAQHICAVLDKKSNHRTTKTLFLEELEAYFTEEEAEKLLKIIIDWGRYAELFAYDYDTGIFSLENP